jgi:hypothetical protein
MHRGYTKRWRKRWLKGYHKDPLLWVLMDYFIDVATYKDKEVYKKGVGKIKLDRGQWFFTYRELAEFMSVNPRRIRTCMSRLTNIGFSTHTSTQQYTIITIVNYNTYQPLDLLTDTPIDKRETQPRHTLDTLLYNTKKVKKVNKRDIREFIPPIIEDVIQYFVENGYSKESAIHAFKYYNEADPPWTDSRGQKVRGWKQKMRGVWFKPENKFSKGKAGVLKPTTYAQGQDLERRQRAAWLKEEAQNDNNEDGKEGVVKVIPLLPNDPV